MHATWRGALSQGLLAIGFVNAVALAIVVTRGTDSGWTVASAWLLVSLLMAGGIGTWLNLRRTERVRRSIAIGLTHHLRTSLAHIQTFNEMLLLEGDSSEDQRRHWLEVVGREAQRLGSSVENLLFLLQDRKSRQCPVRRTVDLGALLEDVASGCPVACATTPETRVRLDVSSPAGILVEADPAALGHAIGNLLDGAARAAAPGSTVTARAESDGSIARILVLFRPEHTQAAGGDGGWRVPENAPLEGGTGEGFGLELAVARHVARLHGGRAAPIHEPGRGGFRLELPRRQESGFSSQDSEGARRGGL